LGTFYALGRELRPYKALVLESKEDSLTLLRRETCSPYSLVPILVINPNFPPQYPGKISRYSKQLQPNNHQILACIMSRIEAAWKGHTCLLTGGTGMLGTALVVKLLLDTRLERIYIIVRGGKGKLLFNIV